MVTIAMSNNANPTLSEALCLYSDVMGFPLGWNIARPRLLMWLPITTLLSQACPRHPQTISVSPRTVAHTSASWSRPGRDALRGLGPSQTLLCRPALLGVLARNLQMAQSVGIYMGRGGPGGLKNQPTFFLLLS